jgi:hypothetical protein
VLIGPLDGNRRAVAIVPATDQNGVANVTITAKDLETLETQVVIKVTVRPVSDPPKLALLGIIAPKPNSVGIVTNNTITILEDNATKDESTDSDKLEFDVSDAVNETPTDRLVISKASSNTELVPLDRIEIG